MRIRVALPDAHARTRSRVRWCEAVILAARKDGSCRIREEESEQEHERVPLDKLEWHPVGESAAQSTIHAAIVASVAELSDADIFDKPPRSAKEALSPSNRLREYWAGAMATHYSKLFKKGVFVVVDKKDVPPDALRLPTMWVFVVKPDKFSARLVVLGNRATPSDIPTASPTPRSPVWKFLFALGVKMGYPIRHFDLSSGFCHTVPQRQVFLPMPEGLSGAGKYLLCRRNLFGMPESPADLFIANWNYMTSYGLEQSVFDPCVYVRSEAKKAEWPIVFVILHVDDFAVVAPQAWGDEFVAEYSKHFDVDDLGLLSRWMGMEVTWAPEGLYLTHIRQIEKMVHRAQLADSRNVQVPLPHERMTSDMCCKTDADRQFMKGKNYRQYVGALNYMSSQGVRADIAFAVSELSRYNDCAGPGHWEHLVRVLHYLRKHPYHGVLFPRTGGFAMRATCDSDYNGNPDERTSKTGVTLDVGGALFHYLCRAQKWTAKSVGMAEYHAMATCAAELLFYIQAYRSLGFEVGTCQVLKSDKPEADLAVPTLFSDSTVALANAAKPINWLSEKLKHVEIHINFFRQYVQAGVFRLAKIPSALNPSDMLTKSYASREQFRTATEHFCVELPFKYRPTVRSSGEARLGLAEPGSGGVRPT